MSSIQIGIGGAACCLPFDPSLWRDSNGNDYKIIHWENKPFVKDGTYCCLYIPLNFGKAVIRAMEKIRNTPGAVVPKEDYMILSDCSSPWYSNVYVSTAKEKVEGAIVEKISGSFLGKSFEGDYSNIGKWLKEVEKIVPKQRESMDPKERVSEDKYYFYYPTCPKCAKKYGKNHVVILAAL